MFQNYYSQSILIHNESPWSSLLMNSKYDWFIDSGLQEGSFSLAQSAEAVEYTDCISAER